MAPAPSPFQGIFTQKIAIGQGLRLPMTWVSSTATSWLLFPEHLLPITIIRQATHSLFMVPAFEQILLAILSDPPPRMVRVPSVRMVLEVLQDRAPEAGFARDIVTAFVLPPGGSEIALTEAQIEHLNFRLPRRTYTFKGEGSIIRIYSKAQWAGWRRALRRPFDLEGETKRHKRVMELAAMHRPPRLPGVPINDANL